MTDIVQSKTPINLPALQVAQNSGNLTGWQVPFALSVANPAHTLIIAPGDAFGPVVYRVSQSRFMWKVGGQRRFNRAVRLGRVLPVESLRYDRTARQLIACEHDEWGGQRVAVSLAIPVALLWTAGGSDHVELAMRRIFTIADDAERAAEDALRLIERIGRDTGTLI